MLYQRPTFTVPASSGHTEKMKAVCAEHGHMDPLDRWGKCWRCGERVSSHVVSQLAERDRRVRDEVSGWKWDTSILDGVPTSVQPLTTTTPTPLDGPIGPETGE